MGFFDKIKQGLSKTRDALSNTLGSIFTGSEIDDDFYEELEESLILADLGVETSVKAAELLRKKVKENHLKTTDEAKAALKQILVEMLDQGDTALNTATKPSVVLVIGVNGVGKTTTIGKIATRFVNEGKNVLLVAADTFRAAAADQLEIWAQRSGAGIVRQNEGADPASVVFDGIRAAKARNADIILIDTAGRLHNKQNLMNELGKISRIVERELPNAAREVLLVLDGTTGQNALLQAKQFKEVAGVTAMAITKLDGTAKGGIVIAVADSLQIPVKFVGVGEQADDLMPFEAEPFVEALI
ncbi:MAG: signal recognition particle-docking protein FtsY [Oscillospiraceae bacterium]|nr:signal recognition particle-docking protein FtsY [Oscillospiraceae bacterium]